MIGDGVGVQCAIVTTRTPVTWVLLGDHVEWGRPRARRRANDAQLEHMLKLTASHLEPLRCQSACTCRNRRSSGTYVVCNCVLDRLVGDLGSCDGGEVTKEGSELIARLRGLHFGAKRRVGGSDALDAELRQSISKLVVLDVYQQTEMVQEIGAEYWLANICKNECPSKSAPQTEVES